MNHHRDSMAPQVPCNKDSSPTSPEASADTVHVNTSWTQEECQMISRSIDAGQELHLASSEISRDDKTHFPSTIFLKPHHIEEGDPLQNDSKLLLGPRVGTGESASSNTIKKSSSSQALPMFRWGTEHRTSGRSKTGLQIQVPVRGAPATPYTSCFCHDKSIIYTYTSSSSSGCRTTHSFGAVGDHLSPKGSTPLTAPSTEAMRVAISIQAPASAGQKPRSPLQDLVAGSVPEIDSYKLFVVGETGPLGRSIIPRVIGPSKLGVMPPRRRSLTDLVDPPPRIAPPSSVPIVLSPLGTNDRDDFASLHRQQTHLQTSLHCLSESMGPTNRSEPPVWRREGPPFAVKDNQIGLAMNACHDLDPPTFSLPFNSTVFMMKSDNITNLQLSVMRGVWSSTEGANKVLQSAWETISSDQKIIFLFSITHSSNHSGKFCGIAEMIGEYDTNANTGFCTGKGKCIKGAIPIRWIAVKDVSFTVFDELKYRGIPISQIRHANKIPGEIGRRTIQAYFEAPHARTAISHPSIMSSRSPISMPTLEYSGQSFQQDRTPSPARQRGHIQQDTSFQRPAIRNSTFPGRSYPKITVTERNWSATRISRQGRGSPAIYY